MKAPLILILSLLAIQVGFAADPAKPETPPAAAAKAVRQRFVPGKPTGENRASFSKLRPSPEKGIAWMQAYAGVGDKFPVRDEDSKLLFEVRVAEGNDEKLVLEVVAKEKTQKIEVPRDRRVLTDVAGAQFGLLFPTTEVAPTDLTTTEQAMIIVTRHPAKGGK